MSASEWIEDIDGILRWTSALGREHLFARGESGRSMPLTAERQVTVTLPPESDMACTTAQADDLPDVFGNRQQFGLCCRSQLGRCRAATRRLAVAQSKFALNVSLSNLCAQADLRDSLHTAINLTSVT